MKQLLQNLRSGELSISDVPAPVVSPGRLIVANRHSAVSVGTERALMEFARSSMIGKARSRPDLVRDVLRKVRSEGFATTYRAVLSRLDQLIGPGYSCAGEVQAVGPGVTGIAVGDLVACAGGGYACHAEIVSVPRNLVSPMPSGLSTRHAALVTLGAIALQGIRRADITPGERVAVIGLGLLGQITAQILSAYGCPVFGLDRSARRVAQALASGMDRGAVTDKDDVQAMGLAFSDGVGCDAVIITAATTSDEPVRMAGQLLRELGRVSVVGDVGLKVPRKLYYERELDLRISRSYGPGRYDTAYEEKGLDYPFAYARWTEGRNMGEFLRLAASGRLNLDSLITYTFPIDDASKAYGLIGEGAGEEVLGVLLEYPPKPGTDQPAVPLAVSHPVKGQGSRHGKVNVGLVGCGNFARAVILPAIKRVPAAHLSTVVSASGVNAVNAARGLSARAGSDVVGLMADPAIDLALIATPHHLHAEQVLMGLEAGKAVFVEKPLCLTVEELEQIVATCERLRVAERPVRLAVGFNRRFAPLAIQMREFIDQRTGPVDLQYRVNAGALPKGHWVADPDVGGGRILGEVCHFIDLANFLAARPPRAIYAAGSPDGSVTIIIRYADDSTASIQYLTTGHRGFAKERIEAFADGTGAVLDDFNSLETRRGATRQMRKNRWRQDKGHQAQFAAVIDAIARGQALPVDIGEAFLSTRMSLLVLDSLRLSQPVPVSDHAH